MRCPWFSLLGLMCVLALAASCATNRNPPGASARQTGSSAAREPFLGAHEFKITTRSPEAQRAFDRGLTLAYSFAHYAAEQEFRRAIDADPGCAMAWWGVALVNGPHINYPFVPPPKAATAWEAIGKARAAMNQASALEQDLIAALAARYASPQPEDRSPLDQAYARAMRLVCERHPRSADAATLFAESVMDLHPWDLWEPNGQPKPWTPEIVAALESALKLDPQHPGANHYYIHAVEASPRPELALKAANRLGALVPGSGHMVHMPSHIYARVGQWDEAAECNRQAMRRDQAFRETYPRPGFYAIYMLHNAHFLSFVAMMQGNRQEALASARRMVAGIPTEFVRDYTGAVDGYLAIVPEVMMRFGMWEDILREPEPAPELVLARALFKFTRAAALTALDRREEARTEREAFLSAAAQVPPEQTMGNNNARHLLKIARLVLDGEMAARAGQYETAVATLQMAAKEEDALVYDEPPTWIQPVRHTLGAVLIKANRPAEAETVYRAELKRNPENGWSLMGLRDALVRQGKDAEAAKMDKRFQRAWARADVTPPSSCYCQQLPSLTRK